MKYRIRLIVVTLLIMLTVPLLIPAVAQDTDLDALTFEITGPVSFGDDGSIMVDGVIVAPAGAFNPSTLKEGDIVIVVGYLLNNDTLQAISLVYVSDDSNDDSPEVTPEPEITPEPEVTPEPGDDETPVETCGNPNHPIATRIAAEFEVTPEEVMALHCQGNGFGNIARAYMLARAANENSDDPENNKTAEDFLDEHKSGKGWGQIVKDSEVHPSALAPGKVFNGKKNTEDDDDTTTTDSATTNVTSQSTSNGNPGNGNGGNGNGNGRGNSGNGNSGKGNAGNGNGNGNSGNNGGGNGKGNSGGGKGKGK